MHRELSQFNVQFIFTCALSKADKLNKNEYFQSILRGKNGFYLITIQCKPIF